MHRSPISLVLIALLQLQPLVVFSQTASLPASQQPLAFVTSLRISKSSQITCHLCTARQKYPGKISSAMKRAAVATLSNSGGKQSKTSASMSSSSDLQTQADKILQIEAELLKKLDNLPPFKSKAVAYVYNPLIYAAETHQDYVRKYGNGAVRNLFVGMNPGPFGMSQNGVPFGDTTAVREWLQVQGTVQKPPNEHPKRKILGLDCERAEVSGTRFWGLMSEACGSRGPSALFQRNFVYNYCPLAFMTSTGANVTPDKLAAEERKPLLVACDQALLEIIQLLGCENVVCVGQFALSRAKLAAAAASSDKCKCHAILHPSPASPQANKGWKEIVEAQLKAAGVVLLDGVE